MNINARFAEQAQIVPFVMPIDLNAGANAGDWVSLKNFHRLTVVVLASAGSSSNDLTMTLNQATVVAGSDTKALAVIDLVATKQGAALNAIAQYTDVAQSAASTYTDGDNGEEQLLYMVDILPEMLDIDNNFDCVQCSLNQVGAAKVGCAFGILWGPRYGADADGLPGAIAD